MIPKIIHYCWFGNNEKNELIQRCIKSWHDLLPDFEFIEWNEYNFDISINQYVQEAYANKKWAFVSDVARIWAVYNFGGIYLDTDVEILQRFDDLLKYDMFSFFETIFINTGSGFGATKGNGILKAILDDYETRSFLKPNGTLDLTTCPNANSAVIDDHLKDFRLDGTTQIINNQAFLSPEIYKNYMLHHGTGSWSDVPNHSPHKHGQYKDTFLKRFLRDKRRLNSVKERFGDRFFKIYVFISFDLLESGPLFFIKHALRNKSNN